MELTEAYANVIPQDLLEKYVFLEVRNAAAVLMASDVEAFDEVVAVLDSFWVYDDDILVPGGNRSAIPIRIDNAFEGLGWEAVRINTKTQLIGKVKRGPRARSLGSTFLDSEVASEGFEVDNLKRRVALDVEWNAKDGNLDRDLSAYRALYDVGLLDVAVIITRDHYGISQLAAQDLQSVDAARRLGTTTTTNIEKLEDRLKRGDAGGCPVWAVGITRATWAGGGVAPP